MFGEQSEGEAHPSRNSSIAEEVEEHDSSHTLLLTRAALFFGETLLREEFEKDILLEVPVSQTDELRSQDRVSCQNVQLASGEKNA